MMGRWGVQRPLQNVPFTPSSFRQQPQTIGQAQHPMRPMAARPSTPVQMSTPRPTQDPAAGAMAQPSPISVDRPSPAQNIPPPATPTPLNRPAQPAQFAPAMQQRASIQLFPVAQSRPLTQSPAHAMPPSQSAHAASVKVEQRPSASPGSGDASVISEAFAGGRSTSGTNKPPAFQKTNSKPQSIPMIPACHKASRSL